MKYVKPGNDTSTVEVTNVSQHGFWLLLNDRELFLPFEHFPWFLDAPIRKLFNVVLQSEQHLHWPDLDIDLDVESILHPERFPLISAVRETDEQYSAAAAEDDSSSPE